MMVRLSRGKHFIVRLGALAAAIAAAVVVSGLPAQAQSYYSYPTYYGPYSGTPCQTFWYQGARYNSCNPSNRYYNPNNRYYNRNDRYYNRNNRYYNYPYGRPYYNAPYYNAPYYNAPYNYNPYTSDPPYYYGGGSVVDDGPGEGGAGQR
jgi:hypothetical protein